MVEVAYPSRSETLYDLKGSIIFARYFPHKRLLPGFICETLSHITNLEHPAKRIEIEVTKTTGQLEGLLLKGGERS